MNSIRRYRRFFWQVILVVGLIVLGNVLTWTLATHTILSGEPHLGDLARMGYLPAYAQLDKTSGPIPYGSKHLEFGDYQGQPIDVITIGDSFSQGGGDSFYQDYIADTYDFGVLNFSELFWYPRLTDRFDPIVNLLNDGTFDRIKPKYVLVQCVERLAGALAGDVDWQASSRANEYLSYMRERKVKSRLEAPQKKGMFNIGNVKYLFNKPFYAFAHHDYRKRIYVQPLESAYFSGRHGDMLLFHHEDLKSARGYKPEMARRINDNMNELARRFAERNIKLIFLLSVDKYDLYREYIADDVDYPASTIFADLSAMPKNYQFVDTRQILLQQIREGETDIFWQDDTHWSWKASKVIAASLGLNRDPRLR